MTYRQAKLAAFKLMPEVGERYMDTVANKTCVVYRVRPGHEFATVDIAYEHPDPARELGNSGAMAQTTGISHSANSWWLAVRSGSVYKL